LSALRNFKDREGHCLIPERQTEDGFRIGFWVRNLRAKKNSLSSERLNQLNSLGFIWDPLGDQWNKFFYLLEKYKLREGHCIVPVKHFEEGLPLGRWVHSQRGNKSSLRKEWINKLNSQNFVWNHLADKWENAFKLLKQFSSREGHCRVPKKHKEDGFSLGAWVAKQKINEEKLSLENKRRLELLGFIWTRQAVALLADFGKTHGFYK